MSSIAENIKSAAAVLSKNGVAQPRREAASLLAFALGKDKTFLVAHSESILSPEEEARFEAFVARRARREPFQYIVGRQEFYNLDFSVTRDVLIPRPETELLVENAIEILRGKSAPAFCEIGVGSGCVSVSILHSNKSARAVGVDISEMALRVAEKNAVRHRVSERLDLKISDVFDALDGENLSGDGKFPLGKSSSDEDFFSTGKGLSIGEKFDLIVSNPPYIARAEIENLHAEVRDYEPETALTDKANGFRIIEKIIADAPQFLKPRSFLLLEIGFGQAARVREMFAARGGVWRTIEILPDLQDIERVVKAEIGG
ncbi:MAG: peptide chain release factor N(5)-glutamine methyltransferase [Acidobacteria bacterium]|nr:peptide chain release factor N(5)-glutamine methyltransferase [Acidobacteriota bacterium]